MNFISAVIRIAELALTVIILFYVIVLLPMPENMKRVCQALLILIAILVALSMFISPVPANHDSPLPPLLAPPSIVR